jgi:hypothetical protein
VHLGELMLEQKGELLVDGEPLDRVVVVEHEEEGAPAGGDVVDQHGQ